jgi:phasin family protein
MADTNDDMLAERAYADASAKAADTVKPVAAKAPVAKTVAAPTTKVVEAPAASKVEAKAAFVAKTATAKKAAPKQAKAKPAAAKPVAVKVAKVPAPKTPAPKIVLKKKPAVAAKVAKTVAPTTVAARVTATATKGKTMIEDTMTKFTADATKFAQDAKARTETLVADMTTRATAASEKAQDFAREAVEFSKGNVEAMVEAGKIAAKGAGEIGQEHVAFARTGFEEGTAALKRYAAVKSPTEFFQLYSEMTKAQIDAVVKHTAKTSEMSVKLANDAFQPLSSRFALAASKLKSAA